MWLWKTVSIFATVPLVACSSGYQSRPLPDRQVLVDLRAIQLESLQPACPSTSAAEPTKFDASDGLSIDEAVAVGLYLNADLRAFRYERGVAEGELVAAGVLPNPELSLQWLRIPGFTKSLATAGIDLGISWQPPRPGERDAKRAAATARIEQVREEITGEEWRVASEVRVAYVELAGLSERLRLADLAVKAQQRVRDYVREQVKGGVATRLDASLADLEYVGGLRDRESLAADRDRSQLGLNRLLGLSPRAAFRLQGADRVLAFKALVLDAERLEDVALERRPDLAAARFGYERAQQDLRLACIQRIPWFNFGPAYSRDGSKGETPTDKFGLSLGFELPIANRNEGEIAKLGAARDKQREEFVAKVFGARAEIHESLQDVIAEERLIRLFEQSVEPALAESEKILQTGIDEKEVDLLRYLATQEKALEGRRTHVESLEKYWTAVFGLERAVGSHLVNPVTH